jgi:hypothetical protein
MPGKGIDENLKTSHFVVAGSVESLGTTTMTLEPPMTDVGIFKVEEILHGPVLLADFVGREITVVFKDSSNIRAGERTVLFTTSWLYGESLAVVEIDRMEDGERSTMRKDFEEARERLANENLRARIALAELVIVGKVETTAPAPKLAQWTPITEHDPDWWEAVVKVQSVEKGSAKGRVTVLFPNSVDIAWSRSPKFYPELEGIWILQRDQQERGWAILRRPGLTALDPLDFCATSELERVRSLITPKRG